MLTLNPSALAPSLPKLMNPRRRRRRRNPKSGAYAKAAGQVFVPPLAFAGGGALAGMLVASVAKPERVRYAAGFGAVLGLLVMGALATDAIVNG